MKSKQKGFRFKRRRAVEHYPILRPKIQKPDEGLTGFVRGFTASDIEERFARALIRLEIGFWFQYKVETTHTLPDQEKRVDFIVFWRPGKVVPVEIYGDRWHITAGDKARDREREREINDFGDRFDWEDLIIVWGRELRDQFMADQKARSLFG